MSPIRNTAAAPHPHRIVWLAVATAALLAYAPGEHAAAAPVPLAPLPQDGVSAPGYADRLGRLHEAEGKARALSRRAALKEANLVVGPTPAMDLYDALFYDLDLTLDPPGRLLTGTAVIRARITGAQLDTLDLHLHPKMDVSSAASGGQPVGFVRAGEILGVALHRTHLQGEIAEVTVAYAGDPAGDYFGWDSYGGQPLIWSLSEPYGAREWWPCKDVNTDKADSLDLRVTVPDGLVVASNGILAGETAADGWRTFHWQERYPIATYLVSLAIHPYAEFSTWYQPQDGGEPMEIRHWVIPSYLAQAQAGYAVTDEMIDVFAQAFGEYPFVEEKYGHAHFPWYGAMEHQTCTSIYYGAYGWGIIAHELAHQWFGDLITCADFHHIWLNEGFATWCEAYWLERTQGMQAYRDDMLANRYFGGGTVYVENPDSFHEVFDYDLTYQKASWIVHMLRGVIGDDDFFAGLALYRERHAYGSATSAQFQALMEEVSGRDLEAFFQQWLYGEYYPAYRYAYTTAPAGSGRTSVVLGLDQVQTAGGLFQMPVTVRVTAGGEQHDFVVENEEWSQVFTFEVPAEVTAVAIDPDHWILRTVQQGPVTGVPAASATARLLPAHPNPFNPRTTLGFDLSMPGPVRLDLFDLRGRRVRTLVDGDRPAGRTLVEWDGRGRTGEELSSGTYLARLTTAAGMQTRKLTLAR
ncbi:MAG: M1 family aminopeptidase [Candidatus Krumholzibacteriia bacterium]